jgi:2-hydroxychromene-2-carboxylate isomerase
MDFSGGRVAPSDSGADRRWAHLVSDVSYEELHRFAERLGIPRRVFQGDHYDIPTELRLRAIRLGAHPVGSRELVVRLRTAGRATASGPRRRGSPAATPVGGRHR